MIVIGHTSLPYPKFKEIKDISDIKQTLANEIVFFSPNATLATHCKDNSIAYAVVVQSITELIIYANLNAKYLLIREKNLAEVAQKIANEYFFDSKILYIINDEGSIENAALLGIDGVIFDFVLKD